MTVQRLAIFDVDGTLVDSQADILASMAAAFGALGLAVPSDDAVRGIVGLSLPIAMARLAPGLSTEQNDALVTGYKRGYNGLRLANGAEGSPLYPGARAALDRLAAMPGVVLGVATGKSRRGLDGLIAAHGWQGRFAVTQCADDQPSKPDPAMVNACLAATGIPAARAVMIGDTSFDIDMGQAAGVRTLGVSWGYHPLTAIAHADAVIDDFGALDAALARLWG